MLTKLSPIASSFDYDISKRTASQPVDIAVRHTRAITLRDLVLVDSSLPYARRRLPIHLLCVAEHTALLVGILEYTIESRDEERVVSECISWTYHQSV
jgi:hypothetical protein